MKIRIYIILSVVMAIMVAGCNHDVFVPETQPQKSAIYLDGDGDSTDLVFSTKQLQQMSVSIERCAANVYNADGEKVKSYGYTPADGDVVRNIDFPEGGRLEIYTTLLMLNIEQTADNRFTVVLDEYLGGSYGAHMLGNIYIDLKYENNIAYQIPIYISANSGYVVEELNYHCADSTVTFFWEEGRYNHTFENVMTDTITTTIDAFEGEQNTIYFDFPEEVKAMTEILHHDLPIVKYPIYVDGKIELEDGAVFGMPGLPPSKEYYLIELPPLTKVECKVQVETCLLNVKATVVLRNVYTHRQRVYEGSVGVNRKVNSKISIKESPLE